jgi:hypothetical protein
MVKKRVKLTSRN